MELQKVSTRLRLVEDGAIYRDTINTPEDAVIAMRNYLREIDIEQCMVLNLDSQGHPLNCSTVSIGDLDESIVPVRNVFKTAILSGAYRIILLHNHPGRSVNPSDSDIRITERLSMAGKLLGVELADHIIVEPTGNYFSFLASFPDKFEETNINLQYLAEMVAEDRKQEGYLSTDGIC